MNIIAASLETYADELKKIVQDFWKYDYILVGGYAKEIIRQLNTLKIFQIVHIEEFDDKYADTRIYFGYGKEIPIRSYNAIFIKKGIIVAQVFLDLDTILPLEDTTSEVGIYINRNDPYDLENDLLDNRATYKEIILEDNKVKTAREFAKFTKGPLICIVNSVDDIKKQLLDEYNNLDPRWKNLAKGMGGSDHAHYTVPNKIYHNAYSIFCYSTELVFVEEKDIEDVSN